MARKPSPTLERDTHNISPERKRPSRQNGIKKKTEKQKKNQCKSLVKIWFRVSFHLAVRPSAGSQTAADCERTKVITQHRRKKIIFSFFFFFFYKWNIPIVSAAQRNWREEDKPKIKEERPWTNVWNAEEKWIQSKNETQEKMMAATTTVQSRVIRKTTTPTTPVYVCIRGILYM